MNLVLFPFGPYSEKSNSENWGTQEKKSSPECGWRTVRKPGLKENNGFEWKNVDIFPISATQKA